MDRLDTIRLFDQLCTTGKHCNMNTKTFVASHPITGLNHRSAEIVNLMVITLQDVNQPDIMRFTRSFLGPKLGLSPGLINRAIEYIARHAQGVFIWVHLVIEEALKYAGWLYRAGDIWLLEKPPDRVRRVLQTHSY
jgi:hypothetical protein